MGTCSLERFVTSLYDSGLIPAREIQSFFDELPEHQCPSTADDLAAEMVRRGMLTPFQAGALMEGKSRSLTLGNYAILDRLGKGGMGQVYRGLHRTMKRVVALKVLPPGSAGSSGLIDRFQREVEATAQLAHPNIVTAFDAGEDKGIRFLVMEYVEGNDLESLILERGPLPTARAVEYVLQAAQGLEWAHWHGMVHRDIKPANLILDWRGTIKLVDFGLVGLVPGVASPGADGKATPTRTEVGALGTPDYVSPEQVADPTSPGPASDIYSLGCTLYFLLVGRPVFGGETAKAKLLAHQGQPAPSLRAVRPDATESLDRLFRHMLAKRPEDRPATMADVIHELEDCLRALFSGRSPESDPVSAAGVGAAASRGVRSSYGTLEIAARESGLTAQVMDGDGRVVVDCPLGQGIAKFALLPGRYRLIVSINDQRQSAQEFEIVADQAEVVEVPGGGPSDHATPCRAVPKK